MVEVVAQLEHEAALAEPCVGRDDGDVGAPRGHDPVETAYQDVALRVASHERGEDLAGGRGARSGLRDHAQGRIRGHLVGEALHGDERLTAVVDAVDGEGSSAGIGEHGARGGGGLQSGRQVHRGSRDHPS